jgi:hypothetical protein
MAGAFVAVNVDMKTAATYFGTLEQAAAEVGALRLVAGSPLPYAYGIETGRTRTGRVARRLGGAHMLRAGMEAASDTIESLVMAHLARPGRGGKAMEDGIRRTVLGEVQRRTPVRSGRLRDSFVVRAGRLR